MEACNCTLRYFRTVMTALYAWVQYSLSPPENFIVIGLWTISCIIILIWLLKVTMSKLWNSTSYKLYHLLSRWINNLKLGKTGQSVTMVKLIFLLCVFPFAAIAMYLGLLWEENIIFMEPLADEAPVIQSSASPAPASAGPWPAAVTLVGSSIGRGEQWRVC